MDSLSQYKNTGNNNITNRRTSMPFFSSYLTCRQIHFTKDLSLCLSYAHCVYVYVCWVILLETFDLNGWLRFGKIYIAEKCVTIKLISAIPFTTRLLYTQLNLTPENLTAMWIMQWGYPSETLLAQSRFHSDVNWSFVCKWNLFFIMPISVVCLRNCPRLWICHM